MAVETAERLLVTVDDAAQSLGISRRKLEYLVGAGEIVSVHVGRAVRIPTSSLRDYVDRLAEERRQ